MGKLSGWLKIALVAILLGASLAFISQLISSTSQHTENQLCFGPADAAFRCPPKVITKQDKGFPFAYKAVTSQSGCDSFDPCGATVTSFDAYKFILSTFFWGVIAFGILALITNLQRQNNTRH